MRWILACAATGGWLGMTVLSPVDAQVVERHAPAPPVASEPVLPAPAAPVVSEDEHPLGANLQAIVLLGPADPVTGETRRGVVISSGVRRIDPAEAWRRLSGYIGQPISKALISRIEASVVTAWRRKGFPFVAVSTPEQEISQGVLQIRVVEFKLGKLNIAGVSRRAAARIAGDIRLAPGEAINSPRLSQDLDWLGRYPYRTVQPAFSPGAALGETDLDLAVTSQRPWQAQAGWSNAGAAPSDQNRYFVGATVGGLVIPDSVLSVLITGSPDFWISHGDVLGNPHPVYESVAGRLAAPIAPRQDIELNVDAIETNQPVEAFIVREQTLEATLAWRFALANVAALPGDGRLGVEVTSQRRMTFFGPTDIAGGGVNIYQVFGGWSDSWVDRLGHASLDVAIHGAPGDLDRLGGDANLAAFTSGRVTSAAYVYLDLNYQRVTPIARGFSLSTQLTGQYAPGPLPDSDQIAPGGQDAARGYYLEAGAFDDALILRDELRAPIVTVIRAGPLATQIGPFAFVDFGYGRNNSTRQGLDVASIGLGADAQVSRRLAATLSVSYPLTSAPFTPAGDWRLEASVTLSY